MWTMPRAFLILLSIFLLLLLAPPPAGALDGLSRGGEGVVRDVIDGDTLTLQTGEQVRLTGIQAPKLPLGRPNFPKWPMADEAKAELERLALGQTVVLWHGGARRDRHGRALAHLVTGRGDWLQGRMLEAGLARVYTFEDNRAKAQEMLALEGEARAARRGLWAHPYYRVREAGELARADWRAALDSFVLVEGRVLKVGGTRARTYLNFGEDWNIDFTASVASGDRDLFERAGLDLKALEGRRVRVRGWLRPYNGPAVELTHPEQIERLED
jgi:endonuclease YncB( thermonuclease family)